MHDQMRGLSSALEEQAGTAGGKPWWKRFRYDPSPLFQRADQESFRQDLHDFFGPRADKYLAVYDRMRAANKAYVYSLSWVGLTIYPWHFYRKMYGMGVRNVLMLFALGDLFGIYGIMAYAFAISSSTNSEYVLAAMKRVAKVDALGLDGRERQDYLRRAGGVLAVAGALAGISLVVLVALTIYGLFLMAP